MCPIELEKMIDLHHSVLKLNGFYMFGLLIWLDSVNRYEVALVVYLNLIFLVSLNITSSASMNMTSSIRINITISIDTNTALSIITNTTSLTQINTTLLIIPNIALVKIRLVKFNIDSI